MKSSSDLVSDIVGFEIDLSEQWYPVPLEVGNEAARWSALVAGKLAPQAPALTELTGQLAAIQDRLRRMDDPYLTVAVWIPVPESGRASCVLGFKAVELSLTGSPEEFAAALERDATGQPPGRRVRDVIVWTGDTDAGSLVGANSLIEHRNPGDAAGVLEERTIFGVFPPRAAHMVQLIFSTHDLAAFANMSQETQELVETRPCRFGWGCPNDPKDLGGLRRV